MKIGFLKFQKYRYLIIASAIIFAAITVLLYLQYKSVRRTQEFAVKTTKANLDLHLLEISEEAKRGAMDHANHIVHGVRQKRIRDRNIPSIERAYTRLAKRYPEIEDLYVVFIDPNSNGSSWQALKFVRPDENDPNVQRYEGSPVGKLIEDAEAAESLNRTWKTIDETEQTNLYAGFDSVGTTPKQYFFHTVYELDRLKRTEPLKNIGLLVFSAKAGEFPSRSFYKKLVAKHQERDKEVNGLTGKLDYSIVLKDASQSNELAATDQTISPTLSRSLDSSGHLFPNLIFGIAAPEIESRTAANEYTQASIFLGIAALAMAILGLFLSWRATQREMQLAQLKSDFLANISHELKTPLTAIRAFGDLIHSGRASKTERIREYGGIIKAESDRLTLLINNILEMSRLERGIRPFRLEDGNLISVVEDTVSVFKHSSEAINSKISFVCENSWIEARFDEGAIRQAIINLLSNAVKYGDSATNPLIEVKIFTDQNNAVIEVKDFGTGIPKENFSRIFKPFQQATENMEMRGGTGLGLAIVDEIAKGHGGSIGVESKVGEGSIFRLIIPLAPEKPPESVGESNFGSYFGDRRRT